MYKNFVYGCSDGCEGIHTLGASGFTCLGAFINPRIFCRSIPGFECIPCTNILGFDGTGVSIGISLQRCRRNIFHIDASIDDCRNLLRRDVNIDGRRITFP